MMGKKQEQKRKEMIRENLPQSSRSAKKLAAFEEILKKMVSVVKSGQTAFSRPGISNYQVGQFVNSSAYIAPIFYLKDDSQQHVPDCANNRYAIIGKAGDGKSLCICKFFLDEAEKAQKEIERCKRDGSKLEKMPIFFQAKSFTSEMSAVADIFKFYDKKFDCEIDCAIDLYIDGIDELLIDDLPTDLTEHVRCYSCRDNCLQNYRYLFSRERYAVLKISDWDAPKIEKFVKQYIVLKERKELYGQEEKICAFISGLTKQGDSFFASPLMVTLITYVFNEDFNEECKGKDKNFIELQLLKKTLDKFVGRELAKKSGNICADSIGQGIVEESFFIYRRSKYREDFLKYEDLVHEVQKKFKGQADSEIVQRICELFFIKDEYNRVNTIYHIKFEDFAVAKHIYCCLLKNEDVNKLHDYFGLNRDVLHYMKENVKLSKEGDWGMLLCRLGGLLQNSEYNGDVYPYSNIVLMLARLFDQAGRQHLREFEKNEAVDDKFKSVIWTQLIQYSDDMDERIRLEERYYQWLTKDTANRKWNLAARLFYAGDIKHNNHQSIDCFDLKVFVLGNRWKWRNLLNMHKNHFDEQNSDDPHYLTRRIAMDSMLLLLEIYKEHSAEGIDKNFKIELTDFIMGLEDGILKKSKDMPDELDGIHVKIKESYDRLKETLSQTFL